MAKSKRVSVSKAKLAETGEALEGKALEATGEAFEERQLNKPGAALLHNVIGSPGGNSLTGGLPPGQKGNDLSTGADDFINMSSPGGS